MLQPSTLFQGPALEVMRQGATQLHKIHPEITIEACLEIICGTFIALRSSRDPEHWSDMSLHVVTVYVPELPDADEDGEHVVAIANDATAFISLLDAPNERPQ